MKKILALALCLCTILAVCVACGAKEVEYKLGMGVVVSMESSKTGNAQVDATVATVVTDAEGKIVACRIDVAQNKMTITDGAVEATKTFKTKMELGDDYNMAKYGTPNVEGGTVKEWYVQTKAFEEYVVGKTAAEVEAIATKEVNAHQIAVDEALLNAGCTMQITEFKAAVVKACKDDQAASFKAVAGTFTLGVAANTTVDSATKAAMQGVTRTLAKELGGKNVRVNCVAPGYIDTEMMRAVGEEKFNAAIARHPMKRMADPSEIASIVAFLCTEDASWVTGQTIIASGGASTN